MVKINLTFLFLYIHIYIGVHGSVYILFSLYMYTHTHSHTHFYSLFHFVKQWYWLDHVLPLFRQNAAVASQTNKVIVEGQKNLSASVQWLAHKTMPKDKVY